MLGYDSVELVFQLENLSCGDLNVRGLSLSPTRTGYAASRARARGQRIPQTLVVDMEVSGPAEALPLPGEGIAFKITALRSGQGSVNCSGPVRWPVIRVSNSSVARRPASSASNTR